MQLHKGYTMQLHKREINMRDARSMWLDGHVQILRDFKELSSDADDDLVFVKVYCRLLYRDITVESDIEKYSAEYEKLFDAVVEKFQLTRFECLSLIQDNFGSCAKYGIRDERHGDCNKAGGLA